MLQAVAANEPPAATREKLAAQGLSDDKIARRWTLTVRAQGLRLAESNPRLAVAVNRALRDPAVSREERRANADALLRDAVLEHLQNAGKTSRKLPTVAEIVREAQR